MLLSLKNDSQPHKTHVVTVKNLGAGKGSFADVLNFGIVYPSKIKVTSPTIILNDACLMERDFSSSLMGKIKYINAIQNLYLILANMGFENVKITHLGGIWVLLDMDSIAVKDKILKHVGVGSWFNELQSACNLFLCDERITWISIEGLPIKAFTRNTFAKIVSSWEANDDDSSSEDDSVDEENENKSENIENDFELDNDNELDHPKDDLVDNNKGVTTATSGYNDVLKLKLRGSLLDVIDELIKEIIRFLDEFIVLKYPSLGQKAKKGWIQELNTMHHVSFVALQETKMDRMDIFSVKAIWGNFSFDYVFGPSVGSSGGILCVWDPNLFIKDSSTNSDYFVAVRGDFNKVHTKHERYGTIYNLQGANAFSNFITITGLVDLPMSKLDRFLITEGLLTMFPSLSALCLDRHLSDNRPILMHEINVDYGPTPLWLFHCWFNKKGFDKMMEDSWKKLVFIEPNIIVSLKKKLQPLKTSIKQWIKEGKLRLSSAKDSIQNRLSNLDKSLDQGRLEAGRSLISFYFYFDYGKLAFLVQKRGECSKLMGIGIPHNEVVLAAECIGCLTFSMPFKFLGVKAGGIMSRRSSQDEVFTSWLSNWKLKALSIGGRPTLIKSVLNSLLLYHMSIFKYPMGVLNLLESIRQNFFNGVANSDKRLAMIGWKKVLASKKNGGLGVSNTQVTVASKLRDTSLVSSFRRALRGGIEEEQLMLLDNCLGHILLPQISDRWIWNLEASSDFSMKSTRVFIDDSLLPKSDTSTRWVNVIPIKINFFAGRVCLDKFPMRLNLSLRGVDIPSILCPLCSITVESSSHLLFSCHLARQLMLKVARWWDLDFYALI
nr:RNA-directed DNA polymerase, eukaryota [Tanacetum cinerariifolium]